MPSLLTIRPANDAPSYLVDVVPYAYDEAARAQLLAMPGVRWVPDRASPNGRGIYRGPVEAVRIVTATLESAGVAKVQWALSPQEPATPNTAPRGGWPAELRDYQRDGAAWIRWMLGHTGGALLADEMGIGKSAQAIVALDGRASGVIVVAPAIVVPHWRKQVERWGSCEGAREDATGWAIYSYEKFRSAKGTLPQADAIVIDEIHYCANPKTQRSRAVADWCTTHPTAFRLALSGTPMTARPRDIWNPLEILWPGRFGRAWDFQRRYCNGHYEEIPGQAEKSVWVSDGASRVDELAIRLQACMLRRTKADVALELPPRTRVVCEVEIPRAARRDLQRAMTAMGAGGWALDRVKGGVSTLLSNVEGYKIEAACELAREITATGGRVLVLTTRKATAHAIGEALGAPVVTGEDDAGGRQAALVDASIGVATMYSVTTGIDLVGYDHIVFTGLDWVPSTLLQAESRIHRLGQDRPVTIHYLIGLGTIDEVVKERVVERLDVFATLTGAQGDERGLAGDLNGGSDDDLIAAIVAQVSRQAA